MGQYYSIMWCTNLMVGFVAFMSNIAATPPTNTVHDTALPNPSYYRLIAQP